MFFPCQFQVIPLPLSSQQRRLYDDYMAGPEMGKAMEGGEADAISTVLNNLRKICNHPRLSEAPALDSLLSSHFQPSGSHSGSVRPHFPLVFPRIADDYSQSHVRSGKLLGEATRYDPMRHVDLRSLNMVYFAHEFNLTAITSDRVRKCCAPRSLIEELSSTKSGLHHQHHPSLAAGSSRLHNLPNQPAVPAARLKLEIQPSGTSSSMSGGKFTQTTPVQRTPSWF